jgi:uncharacterized protein YecE (DUF72 family)
MTRFRIATAGWSIGSAYRSLFEEPGSHLARYATRFDAVEINSSFYRPHRPATYRRWADSVAADFRFSVKIPKLISHERRLHDCGDALAGFLADVEALGEKLGVLLLQLPPSLAFDARQAVTFFEAYQALAREPLVVEPRHASWFCAQAERLLVAHRVARVAADPAPVPEAADPGGWPGLVYHRLHGSPLVYRSPYGEERLREYAARLRRHPGWCILDNTASMAALGDAIMLSKLLKTDRNTL